MPPSKLQIDKGISLQEFLAQIDELFRLGRQDEVIEHLHNLIINEPNNTAILAILGNVYHRCGMYLASHSCYERALNIDPNDFAALSNYGNVLQEQGEVEKALDIALRSYELAPDHYLIRRNLAHKYRETKQFEKARELYQELYAENPDDMDTAFDIGFMSLYLRDFEMAWEYFKHRVHLHTFKRTYHCNLPVWNGTDDISDKSLLILSEQGLGDTILLARFIPLIKGNAKTVTLACDKSLHPIFKDLGVILEDKKTSDHSKHDIHICMMDLPPLFEKDWSKWPQPISISVDESYGDKFVSLAEHVKPLLKVGIVWSGNTEFPENNKRSASLKNFLELSSEHPLIQFYSFQKNPSENQLKQYGSGTILRLGQMLDDFGDTFAAMQHMDLILMTDSGLAHLAGTMNKPIINMLHYRPYWIYFPEKSKTGIYPSMRLIRQSKQLEWESVFEKASEILGALHQEKSARGKDDEFSSQDILKIIDDRL